MERKTIKHDTSKNWSKAKNFIPKQGEFILYDDLFRFKVGNGVSYLADLPFNDEPAYVEDEMLSISSTSITER